MRKWLIRAGLVVLILIAALFAIAAWSGTDRAMLKGYKQNEELRTIKPDWLGTPVDQKDRFINHEFPFLPRASDLLRWKVLGESPKAAKQADPWRVEVRDPSEFLQSDNDGIIWLGHASFFIRMNGVAILT
ncbi:MAG TPA: hypothetical protein VNA22_03570, partial [Pyrinomonadaceae bacterium]|nr:hypothetical protein [Pyrinomonadaceae bacterium]